MILTSSAQTFNDFEAGTAGSAYGFRTPSNSGTTSGNIQAQSTPNTNNIMQVIQGFDINSTRLGEVRFNFIDSSPSRWLRLTTFGATGVPNPAVPLSGLLSFDIYSTAPIQVALGIRETGGSGPVGANGGSTGTIEWLGALQAAPNGTVAPGGKEVTAGSWQTLTFNFNSDSVFAFTGNGSFSGSWGVLESIAITSKGDTDQHIYLDNFQVTAVPEPSSLALFVVAGATFFFAFRRRSKS